MWPVLEKRRCFSISSASSVNSVTVPPLEFAQSPSTTRSRDERANAWYRLSSGQASPARAASVLKIDPKGLQTRFDSIAARIDIERIDPAPERQHVKMHFQNKEPLSGRL
jgi:hypothetical protein